MHEAWGALERALGDAGVVLPDGALERVAAFLDLLRAGGARQNLTRITDEAEGVEKHALDALLGLTLITPDGAPVIDIGSGSGVPGLPIALARPGWRVTLVESERKKAAFLDEARVALGVSERVQVHAERAERLARDPAHREAYGTAILRAVGSVATCLELALPFVRVGGRVVLYRGPADAATELEVAGRVAPLLGGGEPIARDLVLPSGAGRRLLAIPKVAPTPERYPRRDGMPAKRPLSG